MAKDDVASEPVAAKVSDGRLVVTLDDGTKIEAAVDAYPRLAASDAAALARIELSPFGIHWPDLDEDLSVAGLLRDTATRA